VSLPGFTGLTGTPVLTVGVYWIARSTGRRQRKGVSTETKTL
jgi:hypothetical protein